MKRKWTKLLPVFAVMMSLLTSCGSAAGSGSQSMTADTAAPAENTSSSAGYYDGGIASESYAVADEVAAEEMTAGSGSVTAEEGETQKTDSMTLLEEKLVYHCNLEIETLDYPATMASIKDTITKYGGIIQAESESDSGHDWYYEDYRKTGGTMHNYLEVRIPSKDYNSFLAELDGVGKVISKSTSVDNISQRYYDTTAQIVALQIQEKNLLTMLEKCESIEDMIAVEERLSEVQYQLNDLQTSRRYMDMDVAYSYINISVSEVMEYRRDSEPVRRNTFVDRLKNTLVSTGRGFLSFLEGALFLIIRMLPYIVIIVVICLICPFGKIKHIFDNRKSKKAARNAQKALRRQNMMQYPAMQQNQNAGWQMPPTDQVVQQSARQMPQTTQPTSEIPQTTQSSPEMPQAAQSSPESGE